MTMYGRTWKTSERKYKILPPVEVNIPMDDGIQLHGRVFRPDSKEKFPAILGYFAYDMDMQTAPIKVDSFSSVVFKHPHQERANASIEAGDPNFYVRRGYCHVLVNVRGTGKSEGKLSYVGPREVQDGHEVIEWIAKQPWCDGNVAMFGVSYFAQIQQFVASTNPPHLKCLFAPWAATDMYRDGAYHGGILSYRMRRNWALSELSNPRVEGYCRTYWDKEKYQAALKAALQDPEILAEPDLVTALKNPDEGGNPILVDLVLNSLISPFWDAKRVQYDKFSIPAYIGGCWGHLALHLPGAFRSWENLKGPKKMLLAPPAYVDRPLYQLQYESIRWFDYWMKGVENGIMDEAPIKLWINNTREYKETSDWPLPETKWTPFYLHENNLMDEHEYRAYEGSSSYEDSPWSRDKLSFHTPILVEDTEVVGPICLTLYAAATEPDVLFFASIWDVDKDGNEKVLTRGWLRGSHRELDEKQSNPWKPVHPHTREQKLTPGEIYEFKIEILPTGTLFPAGHRIKLQISGCDDKPSHSMEGLGGGHIRGQKGNRVTIFHNEDYPSNLLLPITKGNVLGTFRSGAKPYL